MRAGGAIFLALWLLACGAMAVFALGALLGVPTNVTYSGTPALWIGQLLGSVAAAFVGVIFIRFWRGMVGRILAQVPGLDDAEIEDSDVAARINRGGLPISTTLHIGLQFMLPVVASIVAFGLFIGFWANAESPFKSGVVFVGVMGVATVVPRLAMYFVPARCPKCHGRAYCRGGKPITFVCRSCNHTHDTGVSIDTGSGDL
ncbi:MAG: hypothetical protein DCC68_05015 [Planctomycetota bacterium]|nr:MAG: hypothetical protein DCC68_05015 [Planctomycetota bacterium]